MYRRLALRVLSLSTDGQLFALTRLAPGKEPLYQFNKRLYGPQRVCGRFVSATRVTTE
jgi:hypothetical protein